MNLLFPKRYKLLKTYIVFFLILSFFTRLFLYIWASSEIDFSIIHLFKTFLVGFLFDLGTVSFFTIPYLIYLFVLPQRLQGTAVDKVISYFAYGLGILIFIFTFFAEFTFWEEFKRRFNFIAVDYLVYTYEVVENINQSYPLPLLIGSVLLLTFLIVFITKKIKAFEYTFTHKVSFKEKIIPTTFWISVALLFGLFIQNKNAEWSTNRYENELSKSGIYSFFAAFKNNQLDYNEFYLTQNIDSSFQLIKEELIQENNILSTKKYSISRVIKQDTAKASIKPNVILIFIESMSASFMQAFGNEANITPNLDRLAQNSLFFTNTFATGTRTIRGMEAATLSIPPTPGRSIVKRPNNTKLYTIGEVFKQQGYDRTFFYGGDGYFDNMNQFFGGNGFDIVDRGRGFLLGDSFNAKRTNINDDEVTFENAWGVCDEDIFNKVLKEADLKHQAGKPFFNFIMTTSNHRPYTYPEGKIDIPSGSGRHGAVKYTDYAIGKFITEARKKPWFKNTVFVIMADHCASSAGRSEIDVANYHIPAIIYNLPQEAQKINTLCSQIDIFPTLFGTLNWEYENRFYGKNVLKMQANEPRALVGNYQKLGLLKADKIFILGTVKTGHFYQWNKKDNLLELIPTDDTYRKKTISYFQTADYLFQKGLMELDD
jgi:phosphoglycerol transferase MdoB-like AlkP superfamily enzyme